MNGIPVGVADCTPQMLSAAYVVPVGDLPDHPEGFGPELLSVDGRELSDGDTVTIPGEGL